MITNETSWFANKYLLISNDKSLFLLIKVASETNTCFLNVETTEYFVRKAVISSYYNYVSIHL